MTDLPMEALREVARRELAPHRAEPLFVTLSGAHLYGFPSPDSDFDVRGCHLLPLPSVLSMRPGEETIEYSGIEDGREMDLVSHDAAKFFRLMLKKNGYVLEQIFSPLVVVGGDRLEALRDVAAGCITRHIHHHYRGFYATQKALLAKEPVKRVKTILYAYRVLLTGIHVLRTGVIEAHLPTLLESHPVSGVSALMEAKVREKADLGSAPLEGHLAALDGLEKELDKAFEESRLPEEPTRAEDLDSFLVDLRLKGHTSG